MRLTLRTLLAYMDQILEPETMTELAEKIRESDFASGLMHRIRGTVTRLRLSSPQVLGKGLAADPNSVAEYLDNELPTQRIPDFEKICLESDIHLAEVAACHEILTLLFTEVANPPKDIKRRIYELRNDPGGGHTVARASRRSLRVAAAATAAVAGDGVIREGASEHATGPENSRESVTTTIVRRDTDVAAEQAEGESQTASRMGIWAVLAAAILLAVGGWFFLPRFSRQVAQVPDADGPGAPVSPLAPPGDSPRDQATADPDDARRLPSRQVDGEEPSIYSLPPTDEIPPPDPDMQPGRGADRSDSRSRSDGTPMMETPGATDSQPNRSSQPATPIADGGGAPALPPVREARPDEATPADKDANGHRDEFPAGSGADPPANTSRESTNGEIPKVADARASIHSSTSKEPTVEEPSEPKERKPGPTAEPVDSVTILSDDQPILAYSKEGRDWQRLTTKDLPEVGKSYRVLSLFQPRLLIERELDFSLYGPAEFAVAGPEPTWQLIRGKFSFANLAERSVPLQVAMPKGVVRFTPEAANTLAFIDVRTATPPGEDPLEAKRTQEFHVWVEEGKLSVETPEGNYAVDVGQVWTVTDDQRPEVREEALPIWASPAAMQPIDRQAADSLAELLSGDQVVSELLVAAIRDRRTDVKSLAARSLVMFDIYDQLLATFDDPKFHFTWESHFQLLRSAVQRDPESASKVQKALQEKFPNDPDLFRMLWGFSASQLRDPWARKLVERLDSPSLPVRVFAIENLREITGSTARFRPDYHPGRRRDALRSWQRRLKEGDIVSAQK